MYSTCLFCNNPLGANESVEAFPVGKRLAFDQAKGRLWVVCPKCERWNLTPLEERWDAIEQSEKLYRDTRKRVATEHVGLAKLRDGTTLVRIGEPLRPEFAAWRYGDQFGRRRNRQILMAAGGIVAVGAAFTGIAAAGISVGAFAWMFAKSGASVIRGSPESIVAKINTSRKGVLHVRRRHLAESSLSRNEDGQLALNLRFKNGSDVFVGREAERIASILLPKVNRYGGTAAQVTEAVEQIERDGTPEAFIGRLAVTSAEATAPWNAVDRPWYRRQSARDSLKHGLFGLPVAHRLALEMALHEEAERRAMQGELEELERAWREAEEIAGISDNLFVPDYVSSALDKLKRRS